MPTGPVGPVQRAVRTALGPVQRAGGTGPGGGITISGGVISSGSNLINSGSNHTIRSKIDRNRVIVDIFSDKSGYNTKKCGLIDIIVTKISEIGGYNTIYGCYFVENAQQSCFC